MEYITCESILGFSVARNIFQNGNRIREGFRFSSVKAFCKTVGASEDELCHILWLTNSELAKRKKTGRLSTNESDRLFAAAKFVESLFSIFSSRGKTPEEAIRYLHAPLTTFYPVTPISLLGTDAGIELADAYLKGSTYRQDCLLRQIPRESALHRQEASPRVSRYSDPLAMLGMRRAKDMDGLIRKGFKCQSYLSFLEKTGFPERSVNKILGMTSITRKRFQKERYLSPCISNRLYRMSWIMYLTLEWTHNNKKQAVEWLHWTGDPYFHKTAPIELMCDASGSYWVSYVLWHITEGFPSGL